MEAGAGDAADRTDAREPSGTVAAALRSAVCIVFTGAGGDGASATTASSTFPAFTRAASGATGSATLPAVPLGSAPLLGAATGAATGLAGSAGPAAALAGAVATGDTSVRTISPSLPAGACFAVALALPATAAACCGVAVVARCGVAVAAFAVA